MISTFRSLTGKLDKLLHRCKELPFLNVSAKVNLRIAWFNFSKDPLRHLRLHFSHFEDPAQIYQKLTNVISINSHKLFIG